MAEVRKKIFCTWPTRAVKADKNLVYGRDEEPKEPTKEGALSFVLFKSLFATVSI
jgi:hypothetical protein